MDCVLTFSGRSRQHEKSEYEKLLPQAQAKRMMGRFYQQGYEKSLPASAVKKACQPVQCQACQQAQYEKSQQELENLSQATSQCGSSMEKTASLEPARARKSASLPARASRRQWVGQHGMWEHFATAAMGEAITICRVSKSSKICLKPPASVGVSGRSAWYVTAA